MKVILRKGMCALFYYLLLKYFSRVNNVGYYIDTFREKEESAQSVVYCGNKKFSQCQRRGLSANHKAIKLGFLNWKLGNYLLAKKAIYN